MEVTVHHAKTNLSRLLDMAAKGQRVVIRRRGKPDMEIVVSQPPEKLPRKLGLARDMVTLPDSEDWWRQCLMKKPMPSSMDVDRSPSGHSYFRLRDQCPTAIVADGSAGMWKQ
jgi:antitoxin (DNA-binding transcriptional repressor) of toxin-antitoxin stability system